MLKRKRAIRTKLFSIGPKVINPEEGAKLNKTDIKQILKKYKNVAFVGLSRNPEKASYRVAEYLQKQGYNIIPVNPIADKILGKKVYKSLLDIPLETQKTIEIVDIFRPSESVPSIVDQIIQLKRQHVGPHVVWMQLGIIHKRAAEKALKAGLTVIMNKCMMMEHGRLIGEKEDPELGKIRAKKMQEMMEKPESGEKISTPITMTDANFNETLKKYPLIVVDCWAAWCGPCRMIAPIIEELAKEHTGEIIFGKLNVDENPETATRFNVMGIPTLLILKDGIEVDRMVGVVPKLLIENKLKKYI